MADTLTGLAREIQEFVDFGAHDRLAAAALAARVEEFATQGGGRGPLDGQTRTRLLTRLARTVDPKALADAKHALALLGVAGRD